MEEIWKDIKGYEGLYQISSFGRIKSYDRYTPSKLKNTSKIKRKGKILKQSDDGSGYLQIILNDGVQRKAFKVHRLVAENFLSKEKFKSMPHEDKTTIDINKLEVNHIKEFEKHDNSIKNLEWCTKLYNCNYGTRNKRVNKGKKIKQFDLEGNFIKEWESIKQAGEYLNICKVGIARCCRKEQKTAGNYKWEFKEENGKSTSNNRF